MTVFHDFIAAVAAWGRRRQRRYKGSADGAPVPTQPEADGLRRLRDVELRLYVSSYGQHLLRRELQRRRQAR